MFANPLVIILLVAAACSAVLGDVVNASLIVVIVCVSIVINFVQTYRSQRAAERLREQVAPTATVLRDGSWRELHGATSFPGTSCGSPRATSSRPTRASSKRATSTCRRPRSRASRCRSRSS